MLQENECFSAKQWQRICFESLQVLFQVLLKQKSTKFGIQWSILYSARFWNPKGSKSSTVRNIKCQVAIAFLTSLTDSFLSFRVYVFLWVSDLCFLSVFSNMYLFKVNEGKISRIYEIFSKLPITTRERRHFIPPENFRRPQLFWRFQGI